MKLRFLNILLVLVGFQGFAQESLGDLLSIYNTRSVPYISVQELRMLQVKEEVILLDTRETEEFTVSKIEGAIQVGYNEFSSEKVLEQIQPTDDLIVVYCSLGIRSEEIGEKLICQILHQKNVQELGMNKKQLKPANLSLVERKDKSSKPNKILL